MQSDMSSIMDIDGLPGASVDLVDWLVEKEGPNIYAGSQDFYQGAKETYSLPVHEKCDLSSPLVFVLQRDDVVRENAQCCDDLSLDECLAVDMSQDTWAEKLTGRDGDWARHIAQEFREFQHSRRNSKDSVSPFLSPRSDSSYSTTPISSFYSPEHGEPFSPDYRVDDLDSMTCGQMNFTDNVYEPVVFPVDEQKVDFMCLKDVEPFNPDHLDICDEGEIKVENQIEPLNENKFVLPEEQRDQVDSGSCYQRMIDVHRQDSFDAPSIRIVETEPVEAPNQNRSKIIYCKKFTNQAVRSKRADNVKLKEVIAAEGDQILQSLVPSSSIAKDFSVMVESSAFEGLNASKYGKIKRGCFSPVERKSRKKEQNKRAATKYRVKKRSEMDILMADRDHELERETSLKEELQRKFSEFKILRELFLEKTKDL